MSLSGTSRISTAPTRFRWRFGWSRTLSSSTYVFEKISGPDERRGYELAFDDTVVLPRLKRGARLRFRLTHHWPDDAIEVRTKETLIEGDFYHLAIVYDGSGKAAGIKLFVDGKPVEIETLRDSLSGSIRTAAPLEDRQPQARQCLQGPPGRFPHLRPPARGRRDRGAGARRAGACFAV